MQIYNRVKISRSHAGHALQPRIFYYGDALLLFESCHRRIYVHGHDTLDIAMQDLNHSLTHGVLQRVASKRPSNQQSIGRVDHLASEFFENLCAALPLSASRV